MGILRPIPFPFLTNKHLDYIRYLSKPPPIHKVKRFLLGLWCKTEIIANATTFTYNDSGCEYNKSVWMKTKCVGDVFRFVKIIGKVMITVYVSLGSLVYWLAGNVYIFHGK